MCVVGACDGGTGQCTTLPRADTVTCDDEDACTEQDHCVSGVCAGATIDVCGATIAGALVCEQPEENGLISEAVAVDLTTEQATLLGFIDPVSEIDWFAVELEAGHLLTVSTAAHCTSTLDTELSLHRPDGSLAITDDNSGEGFYSLLSEFEIDESGQWFIKLTAFADSGVGSYLLNVTAAFPPPCASDNDCECAQLTCVLDGVDAGECVPAFDSEVEPNDTAQNANRVAVGDERLGEIGEALEYDWFVVQLTAGQPVVFETGDFCGGDVDLDITLFDELGLTQQAFDQNGVGVGGHARIDGFTPETTGDYRLRVGDEASKLGSYVVRVLDGRCTEDANCDCSDQQCDGDTNNPGACVPALTTAEIADDDAQLLSGAPLGIDERMHAVIDQSFDVDTFAISLTAGTWDFDTLGYCGTELDTTMEIMTASGEQLDGSPFKDTTESYFASAHNVTIVEDGTYLIRISAYSASVGDYLLWVRQP